MVQIAIAQTSLHFMQAGLSCCYLHDAVQADQNCTCVYTICRDLGAYVQAQNEVSNMESQTILSLYFALICITE